MQSDSATPFKFASLGRYRFHERLVIRIVGFLSYIAIRLIGMTVRFDVTNQASEAAVTAAGKRPIYTVWHDRMIGGIYFLRDRGILVLSSHSFDSEYTARCIQRFGFGTVKGSSSKGAVAGLVAMIRAMRAGNPAAFTIDGPKGPRYVAKSGPVLLAKKTGNPILPLVVECESFWKLKSWDRLMVPKPFTRVNIIFAKPIFVDPDATESQIESKREELQASLDSLVKCGAEWRRARST